MNVDGVFPRWKLFDVEHNLYAFGSGRQRGGTYDLPFGVLDADYQRFTGSVDLSVDNTGEQKQQGCGPDERFHNCPPSRGWKRDSTPIGKQTDPV
jgi:hypothetical protein